MDDTTLDLFNHKCRLLPCVTISTRPTNLFMRLTSCGQKVFAYERHNKSIFGLPAASGSPRPLARIAFFSTSCLLHYRHLWLHKIIIKQTVCPSYDPLLRQCCWSSTVSAPGKVLLAGGYLVLERPNVGVVLAATARFFTSIVWSENQVRRFA